MSANTPFKEGYYIIDCPQDFSKMMSDGIIAGRGDHRPLERYIKAELSVHFHLGIRTARTGEKELCDYCIVVGSGIRGENAFLDTNQLRIYRSVRMDRIVNADGFSGGICPNWGEQLVFVSRVQLLKKPERIKFLVRSVIRLQCANLCDSVDMEVFQSPERFLELGATIANNEERVPILDAATSECPSEIIESAPRIVDTITNQKGPMFFIKRFGTPNLVQVLKLFIIVVTDNGIGLAIEEDRDFVVQQFKVFLSTGQFVPTLDQG